MIDDYLSCLLLSLCFMRKGLCGGFILNVCLILGAPKRKKKYPASQHTSVRISFLLSCLLRWACSALFRRSEHHSVAPLSSALSLGFHHHHHHHQLAGFLLLLLLAAAGTYVSHTEKSNPPDPLGRPCLSPLHVVSAPRRHLRWVHTHRRPAGALSPSVERGEKRARHGRPPSLFFCVVVRRALLLLPQTPPLSS